jgi:hypothetical protein
MKFNYYTYLFFIITIILVLIVQYHNYCTDNKLRHTMFETLEYFGIVNKNICHSSITS